MWCEYEKIFSKLGLSKKSNDTPVNAEVGRTLKIPFLDSPLQRTLFLFDTAPKQHTMKVSLAQIGTNEHSGA